MTDKITIKEFLESTPIGVSKELEVGRPIYKAPGSGTPKREDPPRYIDVLLPRIRMFCDGDCTGERQFDVISSPNKSKTSHSITVHTRDDQDIFVRYLCGDCKDEQKLFALRVDSPATAVREANNRWELDCRLTKIGEVPKPTTPLNKKIKKLISKEWQLYRKGADDEAAGNGIGAFAYYRRVVEDSRDHIVDAICKAMEKLGADPGDVAKVAATKDSQQFSSSVEEIKDYIPRDLFIAGTNPLTALYGTLSDGMHNATDAECLEAARYIRTIIDAFGQKLQTVMDDHDNVANALTKIQNFRRTESDSSDKSDAEGGA